MRSNLRIHALENGGLGMANSGSKRRPAQLRFLSRSQRLIDHIEEVERRLAQMEPAPPSESAERDSYVLKNLRRHIQRIRKALGKQRHQSRLALSKPAVDQDFVDRSVRAQRKLLEELLKKEMELVDKIATSLVA